MKPGDESKVFTYMQPLAFAEAVLMFRLAIAGVGRRAGVTNVKTA